MKWCELPTPAFVVDLDQLEANALWMRQRSASLGVQLRPHVKTHKCLEAARIQHGGEAGPVTVSTVAEARFFVEGGFDDVTYAVPVAADKLAELAAIQQGAKRLNILLDHPQTLDAVEQFSDAQSTRFSVFLKVDCGYRRAGVDPAAGQSVALARRLADSRWVDFQGILTHGGHSYAARGKDAIRAAAAQERDAMTGFAKTLRLEGLEVSTVSVGSTPTLAHVDHLSGVTEARPGNYAFLDGFQAAIGTAPIESCSVSVATQVVGIYPDRERLLVDAGALALSKDAGSPRAGGSRGYGTILGDDALEVVSISQEHGLVEARAGVDWSRFRIGQRLRIVPNHSCLTAALFSSYAVVRDDEVVAEWRPVRGW